MVRRSRRTIEYRHEGNLPNIDLHWRWTANPYILQFETDRVWEGDETEGWVELFLFLVVHGGRHSWCRMGWLLDIHELAMGRSNPPLDWGSVRRRAEELDAVVWLSLALTMSREVFGTPSPIPDLPAAPKMLVEECIRAIVTMPPDALSPVSWKSLAWELRAGGSLRHRIRMFWFALTTPSDRDIESIFLPEGWQAGYLVLRPFLWLARRLAG